MSRRTDIQDATGRIEYLAGRGTLQAWGTGVGASQANGNPTNGVTGFAPGCTWQNLFNGTIWINIGTFISAQWIENDGTSGEQTRFGASTLGSPFYAMFSEGNLYRNCGNPIAQNGADTTDDILDGFQLPANAFDAANRQMMLNFNGSLGSTGNNKRIKVWVNPTMLGQTITNGIITGGTVTGVGSGALLFDSGVQTTNGGGWQIDVIFCKFGVKGSNTQYVIGASMFGSTHGGTSAPTFPTIAENAAMNFVVTGSSPTTGAAGDVVLQYTEVNAMN